MKDYGRFKNATGNFLLQGLFYETTLSDKSSVVYTLKDAEHQGYPSLYQLYMEEGDPTEYLFANKYLSGWAHWERLCECTWFQEYVLRWRKELELALRAKALKNIMTTADGAGRDAFQASKFLLEGNWLSAKNQKVGRPSKEAIRQAANEHFEHNRRLQEDAERVLGKLN